MLTCVKLSFFFSKVNCCHSRGQTTSGCSTTSLVQYYFLAGVRSASPQNMLPVFLLPVWVFKVVFTALYFFLKNRAVWWCAVVLRDAKGKITQLLAPPWFDLTPIFCVQIIAPVSANLPAFQETLRCWLGWSLGLVVWNFI